MNQSDSIRIVPRAWLVTLWLAAAALGVWAYPHLPERIPLHWDWRGEVNRYGSKAWSVPLLYLMSPAIYGLLGLTARLDPRRANYPRFGVAFETIRTAAALLLLGVWLVALWAGLGHAVDVGRVAVLGVGLLFAIIGNRLGQLRHNYFVGIRTPWTLADERVWQETHRFGGRVMVVGGVV
ncbi:MAG TPA: SdpI family protein, partial [Limnochordia bacterium]|nr:SdpI family protein [Limnochordia bacterium]